MEMEEDLEPEDEPCSCARGIEDEEDFSSSSLNVTDLSNDTCFFPSLFLLSAFSTIPVSWLSCASMYIIRALASSALAGPAVCE